MSASLVSTATSRSKNSGAGSQAPMSRCAIVPSSTPLSSARARTTSRAEAPTRKLPVMSLFQT